MGDMLLTQFAILQEKFDKFAVEMCERQARVETLVQSLHADLKGNGQPGRCTLHGNRLTVLESWRSWMSGALWGMGAIAGVCGAGALWLLQQISSRIKW